jgi:hypothetical protein
MGQQLKHWRAIGRFCPLTQSLALQASLRGKVVK